MKATPTCVPRNITLKAPALLTSLFAYMDYCKLGEGLAKAAFIGPKRGLDQSSSDAPRQKKLDDRDDACGKGKTKKQANLQNRVLLSTYCEPFDKSQLVQKYYCCPNQEDLSECDSSVTCAFAVEELNAFNPYDVLTAFPCRHHFKTEFFQSPDLTTITNPFNKMNKFTCPLCVQNVEYYYTGPLLFGKPHTLHDGLFGILWSKKGRKYEGEFKNGLRNGQGKQTLSSGDVYTGEWKDDKQHGQGEYMWFNGQVYKGEFENGEISGQGTMKFSDGRVYKGGFKNGQYGQGMYKWPDGTVYDGEFKNNRKHGQGTMKWPDGEVLTGEWKDSRMNGQGIYTWPDGTVYEGGFKDGDFYGQGTMKYANGNVYIGEWNDKKNGQGKLTYPNGDVYTGIWKDGKRHGKGEYKFANGDVESRQYEGGKLLA